MSTDNLNSSNRLAKGLPGFLRRTIRSTNASSSSEVPISINGNILSATSEMNPPNLNHDNDIMMNPSLPSSSSSNSNDALASVSVVEASAQSSDVLHPPRSHASTTSSKSTSIVAASAASHPPPTAKSTAASASIPIKHDKQILTTSTTSGGGTGKRTYKESVMDRIMSEQPVLNLAELKKSGWNGIPPVYRPKAWKLLLGYLPTNVHRRTQTLERKRNEYQDAIRQFYDINDNSRTFSEQETLRQVLVDVPRTAPDIPLFRRQEIRLLLSRLLYVWAMKHPASSYVQGINDLATPLLVVFLSEYAFGFYGMDVTSTENDSMTIQGGGGDNIKNKSHGMKTTLDDGSIISTQFILDQVLDGTILDVLNKASKSSTANGTSSLFMMSQPQEESSSSLQSQSSSMDDTSSSHEVRSLSSILTQVEADVYWCLTNLLSGIQDHYTSDQPGVQRMILRLEELVKRIDDPLVQHFQHIGVEFIQFAFKWMNCLLLREFTLPCVIRLWDTYFSEGEGGFEVFHVYVCAAFLCHFSADIRRMSFDEAFGFLQVSVLVSCLFISIIILLSTFSFYTHLRIFQRLTGLIVILKFY